MKISEILAKIPFLHMSVLLFFPLDLPKSTPLLNLSLVCFDLLPYNFHYLHSVANFLCLVSSKVSTTA